MRQLKILLLLLLTGATFPSVAQYTFTPDSIAEGRLSIQLIEQYYPWFSRHYDAYTPEESKLIKLKKYRADVSFTVVLGTWCSDSRELIPQFFKVLAKCGIGSTQYEVFGTLRNKTSTQVDLSPLHIELVPTIIVKYKGVEAGRIVEQAKRSVEADIVNILKKHD